ncbi:MAG: sulfite exporter TauE/SafE family protein [Actinobacteria bacterium]|nr:sulfite exporter TauE/SafE family protein [Actinomycetota bacterium]
MAGALTTLAPCVLPLLPIIVGGSVARGAQAGARGITPAAAPSAVHSGAAGGSAPPTAQEHAPTAGAASAAGDAGRSAHRSARRSALIIAGSLGLSIVVFTLVLKASTAFIGIPTYVWEWVSGGILILLGVVSLFPIVWERISAKFQLQSRSSSRLAAARKREGAIGEVLTGAALGPVFTSCSPLYAYVIVTVLPADFSQGLLLLIAYVVGLSGTLLLISLLGQRAVRGARWASDPHGWFRRALGAVFVIVGVLVLTGWMKDLETWLIANSPWQPWNLDSGFIP